MAILFAALALGPAAASGVVLAKPADALNAQSPLEVEAYFDIPAQPLDLALLLYSRQSGIQVISAASALANKAGASVRGIGTARGALARLLRGTGLAFVVGRGGTVTILDAPLPAVAPGPRPGAAEPPMLARAAPAIHAGTEPDAGPLQLEEVVVTATRQVSTVNRVPLSVSALTRESFQRQGIRSMQDLARTAPAVNFRRVGNGGAPNIQIRGIGSTIGAATTGVYLDDTPLQKRDINNGATGAPFPQLFDLERVEVLRGPQGTLFGGSSQGGTIRFITASPSLSRRSMTLKAEASTTDGGDPSWELGVAVGGPIIADKLGFRASAWRRQAGGYVDHVSLYDGHEVAKNTNDSRSDAVRLAVTWAPNPDLHITPAIYYSVEDSKDIDLFWEDVAQYSTQAGWFTNRSSINGVNFDFPDKFMPATIQGPYKLGPFKTPVNFYRDERSSADAVLLPRQSNLSVGSLTVDYHLGSVQLKSITSLTTDRTNSHNTVGFGVRSAQIWPTTTSAGFVSPESHTGENAGAGIVGGPGLVPLTYAGFPQYYNRAYGNYRREGIIQEIRFSRPAREDRRLSWVAGLFYASSQSHVVTMSKSNTNALSLILRGIPEFWYFGMTNVNGDHYAEGIQFLGEEEIAGYGEANFAITDRLKLIAGVRMASNTFRFSQSNLGSSQGAPPGYVGTPVPPAVITAPDQPNHAFPNQPGDDAYIRSGGKVTTKPINPKFGLAWQRTEQELYYFTAAKGYRGGGVNAPVNPFTCAGDLAALGLTGVGTPVTFRDDSIWSYEGGAKLRLFGGKAQLNSSLFYIAWDKPQLAVRLRCAASYIDNVGKAVSKGGDLQATVRPMRWLTLNGAVSYTDARYTATVASPTNPASITVGKGDSLGAPKWQYNIGAELNFDLAGKFPAYIRADYQYAGTYFRGAGVSAIGYDPLISSGAPAHFLSVRAGVAIDRWEASVFVNNLTNSQDRLLQVHVTGQAPVYSSTFRPRELGASIAYRF